MTARKRTTGPALSVVLDDAPMTKDPDPAMAAQADAYDMGLKQGRTTAAERFAAGMRVGIELCARLAGGDTVLARQVEMLVDSHR